METTDPVVRALDALVGGGVRRRARSVWPAIPVVLLTATKGRAPEWTPLVLEVQEQLAAECGGRHRVVADSGHYLQVDRPDLVVDAVRELAG